MTPGASRPEVEKSAGRRDRQDATSAGRAFFRQLGGEMLLNTGRLVAGNRRPGNRLPRVGDTLKWLGQFPITPTFVHDTHRLLAQICRSRYYCVACVSDFSTPQDAQATEAK